LEEANPAQKPHRTCPALVSTLREIFLPTNCKVIIVQFAGHYYIPTPTELALYNK
jgi:hypothetical protein